MKLVLFNILGNKENGTGHIYRSLSLAKEVNTSYKIVFITSHNQKLAIQNLKKTKYEFYSCKESKLFNKIKYLNPSVVINDVLSTKKKNIKLLKKNKIKVINFEDLGTGTLAADLTINEIYQKPKRNTKKILWGEKFFFLRDEFLNQKKNKFENIKNLLLFFGGSDPNNLTLKTIKSIYPLVKKFNLKILIITGIGYKFELILKRYVKNKKNIQLIKNTRKISKYMKKCQIAFTSNGRTTYELAHMNIPSFVISHNKRESQHKFAFHNRGFIYLGEYKKKKLIFNKLNLKFTEILNDSKAYKKLYRSMLKINFSLGRQRVKYAINKINKIF